IGYGERYILEIERNDPNQSHSFQSGKSVSLFSNVHDQEAKMPRVNGVVNFVKKDMMVITLTGDYLPDWIDDGKVGVDLLFDEASYREMEYTLKKLIKTEEGRIDELKRILLGQRQAHFSAPSFTPIATLNESQNRSEEHTSELQSRENLVCRLLLEKK